MDRKEAHQYMLECRGVDDPCPACNGAGVRVYANTATWRGGIGGNAVTSDVCDKCWGTGDARRKGSDLRALKFAASDESYHRGLRDGIAQERARVIDWLRSEGHELLPYAIGRGDHERAEHEEKPDGNAG